MPDKSFGAPIPDGDVQADDPTSLMEQRPWNRSSRCGGGSCVEVTDLSTGGVAVRDSKMAGTSPVLVFSDQEWHAFICGVKAGEFDRQDASHTQIGLPEEVPATASHDSWPTLRKHAPGSRRRSALRWTLILVVGLAAAIGTGLIGGVGAGLVAGVVVAEGLHELTK